MNDNIIKNIKMLPPLPKSTIEIYKVCSDADSSLVDVVNVVKKDPIATATLLKIANSSLYGSRNIKIVDRAVGMFGKSVTKAFLVNDAIRNSFKIDLTPYKMTEDSFMLVSQKRNKLMTDWYSDIDKNMLDILSTTSQVGNVGQILLAKELVTNGKKKDFLSAISTGEADIDELEDEFLGTTTLEITAQVLHHWKLDQMLVNAIEYSKNLDSIDRATSEVQPYAIANYVVYNSINILGNRSEEAWDGVLDLLHQSNFNEEVYEDLLQSINVI